MSPPRLMVSAEGESPPTAHAQPARFDVFVHAAVPPLCGLLSQWWTGDLVRNWLSAVNLLGEHLNARSGPHIDLSRRRRRCEFRSARACARHESRRPRRARPAPPMSGERRKSILWSRDAIVLVDAGQGLGRQASDGVDCRDEDTALNGAQRVGHPGHGCELTDDGTRGHVDDSKIEETGEWTAFEFAVADSFDDVGPGQPAQVACLLRRRDGQRLALHVVVDSHDGGDARPPWRDRPSLPEGCRSRREVARMRVRRRRRDARVFRWHRRPRRRGCRRPH